MVETPMGFVIESTDKNFYYAGDTALTYDMKLIGNYRKIDFAFLPMETISRWVLIMQLSVVKILSIALM